MYIFEGERVWNPSSTPAVQQSWDIRQAKLCLISHYRNYASQQVHRGRSLPLFVPPTTANFSTSIALCVYLPQEGSFGTSQELCVGEVARRSRGSMHRTPVCFCILVFVSTTIRSKDDIKLETLSSKCDLYLKMLCAQSRNCYFCCTKHLVQFLTGNSRSHLVSESCYPGEIT